MRLEMVNRGWVFVSEMVFDDDKLFVFHHRTKPLVVGLNWTDTEPTKFWTVLIITRSIIQLDDPVIEGFAMGNVDFKSDREQCSMAYWQLFERAINSDMQPEALATAVTNGLKDMAVMDGKFDTIDVSFIHNGYEAEFVHQFDMMYFRHITRHVGGIDFRHYYPRSA